MQRDPMLANESADASVPESFLQTSVAKIDRESYPVGALSLTSCGIAPNFSLPH
jgi:hypothetical protein